ncbi:MAG: class I SAM-dependent methyltransferase [Methanomassiliicoccales archaeon]
MAESVVETISNPRATSMLLIPKDLPVEKGTPQYYSLRQAIFRAGNECIKPQSRIVDLRCGEGDFIEPFIENHQDLCRFLLLDSSWENVCICASRFHFQTHLGFVIPSRLDLARGFPEVSARLIICINGLSELGIERKEELLQMAHRHLENGGGFILVENLEDEEDQALWQKMLIKAGFNRVEKIWSLGRTCAWIAKK